MSSFSSQRARNVRAFQRPALFLVCTAVLILLPFVYPPFRVFQFSLAIVLALAALGLNLLTGYTGQISLGHSAFFAVGAYTAAIVVTSNSVGYLLALPIAAAVCFAVGAVVGLPALRLSGGYLGLVTLALAVVTPPLIKRFSVTGGSNGIVIKSIKAPTWTGLGGDQWLYFVSLTVTAACFLLARNLTTGRIGRAMMAVKDNETAATVIGIELARIKVLTFAISAMLAGIAGVLYAFTVSFVSPESFDLLLAISFLAAIVVGGLGTIAGAVFGGIFIAYVPIFSSNINPALGGVIYGAALLLFMFVLPGGIASLPSRARELVRRNTNERGNGDAVRISTKTGFPTGADPLGQLSNSPDKSS